MRLHEITTLAEKILMVLPISWHDNPHHPAKHRDEVRVLYNPSVSEFNALVPHFEEGVRFFIHQKTGDLYIWDSFEATHDDIFKGLYLEGDVFNSTIFGHLITAPQPIVQLDTSGWHLRPEVRKNPHLKRIMPKFRFVEID